MSRRRYRFTEAKARAARQPRINGCRALLVVDNAPLLKAAWRDLCKARKLLEKASRDLHRHEEIDLPGFRAWLGATFPDLVSSVRDLTMQLDAKERIVSAVEGEAFITRRSPRTIWQEWQQMQKKQSEEGASPDGNTHSDTDGGQFGHGCDFDPWSEDPAHRKSKEGFAEFCARMGLDLGDPAVGWMYDGGDAFGFPDERSGPRADEVREIYRRLVQQLHPDRGGEWTPQRARVWHQVQEAWAARDVDMLARLEVEWEVAADTLGPTSPVGRLRMALEEIRAARRDTESRVRRYRKMPEWRFSISPPDERLCEDLRCGLERECEMLRRRLDELEAIVAEWERPIKKRARGRKIPESKRQEECRREEESKPEPKNKEQYAFDF